MSTDTNQPGGPARSDGADRVMDPALQPGQTSASGNRGANNPGLGQMDAGNTGIVLGSDLPQGHLNPDNVQTVGASGPMGSGGMGGTGLIGQPAVEDEGFEADAVSGVSAP